MLIATHELTEDTGSEQVYNGMDCCMTHEIFGKLLPKITQAQPAYNFERAMQAPVLDMMLRGFRVDPEARERGIVSVRADLERLDYILDAIAHAVWDKPLNPNSGMQLKALFYDRLGITPIQEWIKGEQKFPMNHKTLEAITNYYQGRVIANTILSRRQKGKQLSVLETEVDRDWRMRTSYNIGGTKTGRFSSSKSPDGTGTNLQNIEEALRHIFIADDGYVLCGIDVEQSDSRFVGFMCGVLFDDWDYLDACESGDLHTTVAKLVWPVGVAWTGDPKKDRLLADEPFYRHHTRRDMCKRIGHGANFYGKAPTLAKETHVPVPLVTEFIENYFGRFTAIPKWQAWTSSQLQSKQQLTSVHGRVRDFFDRTSADETLRKGLAFLAASATADNLDMGMYKIWKHMPEVQLIANVHDAVYFQFPEHLDASKVVAKAQELLTLPLYSRGREFVLPTEAKIGKNWGNFNDDASRGRPLNLNGLKKFKPTIH